MRGDSDRVVLTVHNAGPQIPKQHLRDIFDPFRQFETASSRAKTAKTARSIGLGLYIVQAIVMAHEGTINVESTESGTTFTVRLPRTPRKT